MEKLLPPSRFLCPGSKIVKVGLNRTDFISGLVLFFLAVGYGFEAWRLPRVM
jgi:hypothetical protein